jgi:OmpA-OmpF porin, OOP family
MGNSGQRLHSQGDDTVNTFKLLAGVSTVLGVLALAIPAQADDISQDPSLQEMIQKLTPQDGPKMRGIRKAPADAAPAGAATAAPAPAPSGTQSAAAPATAAAPQAKIDLRVQFEFNSAQVSSQAANVLSRLGEAIQSSDLRDYSFLIVGHTDGKGDAAYNQRLSEERAASVRNYLVNMLGVEAHRLTAIGKGESEPLTPAEPEAGVNRRVEVRTLGG